MSEIKIVIPGEPVAKGRARYSNSGGFVRAYTPSKTKNAETLIKVNAMGEVARQGFKRSGQPLILTLMVFVPIPVSKLKEWKKTCILPITRPDIDNYLKLVMDALNGIVYKDDNQVVCVKVFKLYSQSPRLEIFIREVDYAIIQQHEKETV